MKSPFDAFNARMLTLGKFRMAWGFGLIGLQAYIFSICNIYIFPIMKPDDTNLIFGIVFAMTTVNITQFGRHLYGRKTATDSQDQIGAARWAFALIALLSVGYLFWWFADRYYSGAGISPDQVKFIVLGIEWVTGAPLPLISEFAYGGGGDDGKN